MKYPKNCGAPEAWAAAMSADPPGGSASNFTLPTARPRDLLQQCLKGKGPVC